MWTVNQEQYLSFKVETIFPGYATNHSSSFQKNSLMTISPVSWQGPGKVNWLEPTAPVPQKPGLVIPTSLNFNHAFLSQLHKWRIFRELRWSSLCLSTTYNTVCLFVCCCRCCFFKRKKKTKTSTVFDHAMYIRQIRKKSAIS